MKRIGYIYDRMKDWYLIKEAERIALRNKKKNKGVRMHAANWMANLAEIQKMIVCHKMKTSEYHHDRFVSGQGKMRDISKLHFHPSHIEHQLLVMASAKEIDRSLIRHTYASRIGYGQHRGAETMNGWIQEAKDSHPWYVQFDIRKYYDNIPHSLIRSELERRFKDKAYINAMMEPIEKFAPDGVGIPLGIRPSQTFGNLALASFDRFVKEDLKCRYYMRYLDDFVMLCESKGQCHHIVHEVTAWMHGKGFELHQPKINRLTNGLNFLGYVTYPNKGMFWRRVNKANWLRHRAKVTNKRRLRELDASAWGFLSHGNGECKRLYKIMGGVKFRDLGINIPQPTDKDGKRVIDAQRVSMEMVLNKPVEVVDMVDGVTTQMGTDRMVLHVNVMGTDAKLIVNAMQIKQKIAAMWAAGVTRMRTTFIDNGGKHYDISLDMTEVLEMHNRQICKSPDGVLVYADDNSIV